jgi:hypothetical protein
MAVLAARRRVLHPLTAAGRLIDSATSWWVPKLVSGTTLVDQRGSSNMAASGSPTLTNDGTYNISQLRSASSQYYQAADADSLDGDSGDFSLVIVLTPQVSIAGTKIFFGKRFGAGIGWNLFVSSNTPTGNFDSVGGSPVQASAANISLSTRSTLAAVRSGTTWRVVKDGTAGTAQTISGNIANSEVVRINRGSGTTTAYADQDFYGAAWFKGTALSDAQTVQVGNELLAATAL